MDPARTARVVLAHDWLTGTRGGERCLERLAGVWPNARLLTLFHRPGSVSPAIENRTIQTSFLQRLPGVAGYYRHLLPVFPFAANWPVPCCDAVVSLSHCVAKAVQPPPGVPHICYCFTPMRYAWHLRDAYLRRHGGLPTRLIHATLGWLRRWDRDTAGRVSHFVAISETVRRRIRECYDRDAEVVYPPVAVDYFTPEPRPRENYYLVVSALVPYKRVDLAVLACNRLGRHLVIVGTGPEERRLRALAGPKVHVVGRLPDQEVRHHLRRCKALLFPGEEDFGIVPVEAMACGTPVIALGRGGATETVIPPGRRESPTGVWFGEQSSESLAEAIAWFEKHGGAIEPITCRRRAEAFAAERFDREFLAVVDRVLCGPAVATRLAA